MRGAALGFAALAGVMALATAARADGPQWSGFYLGLTGGANFAAADQTTTQTCSGGGSCYNAAYHTAINALGATHTDTSVRFTGGVDAGYNVQFGNFVAGVEVEFSVLDASTTSTSTGPAPGGGTLSIAAAVKAERMYSARPKLGFVFDDKNMIYATGGWAWTELKGRWSFANAPFAEQAAASKDATGWVLGAGFERQLTENVRMGAEYLHIDFGSVAATGVVGAPASPPFSNVFDHRADLTSDIVRARFSYTF